METINLFPTTVGRFNLINYTDWVAKRYEHHMFEHGQTGEIDGKVLVHLDPQLNSFMLEVTDCIDEYLCAMNVSYDIHFMKTGTQSVVKTVQFLTTIMTPPTYHGYIIWTRKTH